jgi:transcriptional antiterminator NusG
MSRNWYILHTYTGYEGKIERTIRSLLEKKEIDSNVILDVKVPVEEITETTKDGKKKTRKNNFLPGYVMIEMDLPEVGWKTTCSQLRRIQGVTGFVGTNPNVRPVPISTNEAKNLLQRSGVIKGEKPVYARPVFSVGDVVKITDGPFASFSGNIKEVNLEKEKLSVDVQIFGRPTPVEVSFSQVEKG